ncbi:hypothetical protein C0992_010854, partial [Termitomyces sp. T32_za158]
DLFDGGAVVDYLNIVKTFLDANPNEVLTFIFTNPEGVSLPDVWKPAFDAAAPSKDVLTEGGVGITPLAFVPPSLPVQRDSWPTLGQMIDSGKRVVVFLDAGADGADGGVVDFILPEFDMVFEDPFDSTDPTFPCSVDRISGPLSPADHENLINHNLDINIIPIGDGVLISDRADAPTTNSVDSILSHANGCAQFVNGRAPNFVLLDWMGSTSSKPKSKMGAGPKQRKRPGDAPGKGYYDQNSGYWPTAADTAYGYPAAVPHGQYPAYYPPYYHAPVAMPEPQPYAPPRPVIPPLARSAPQPQSQPQPGPAPGPPANSAVIPPVVPPRERPKKRKTARKKMPTAVISFELPARRPSLSSTNTGQSPTRGEIPSPTRSVHASTERPRNPLPKLPVDVFATTPYKQLLELPELPVWPAKPSVVHDDHHEAQRPPQQPQPQPQPQKRSIFLRRKSNPPLPPPAIVVPTNPLASATPAGNRGPPPPPPPRWNPPPPPIFFNQDTEYAGFLNHSPHSVSFERVTYPTAAHLIEATKFLPETAHNEGVAQLIRGCADLADVYRISHAHRAAQNDEDGEAYMDRMEQVMYLKFNQHASLADLLLSTGDAQLVYDDPSDSFWGVGGTNGEPGGNELGCMLEDIRARLRSQRPR